MRTWLRLGLTGMIAAVTALLRAEIAVAAAPDPTSGYAEITAPDDPDVAFVPKPDPRLAPRSYAIETVPDRTIHELKAPQVLASLPAGPPLAVDIRFDPRRTDNPDRAAQIAAALGHLGIVVHAIDPAASVSDEVGFVFAEDQAAADDLAHHLAGLPPHATRIRLDPHHTNEALPGTIVITLGSERGTS